MALKNKQKENEVTSCVSMTPNITMTLMGAVKIFQKLYLNNFEIPCFMEIVIDLGV